MNNLIRFLIAIILFPIILLGVVLAIIALFPLLILSTVIIGIIITIFAIVGIVAFFYYISRKEPKHKITMHSKSYSIKRAKRK